MESSSTQNEAEPDSCTICLEPFIDRAIVPVCAHEFCFECILLWSEQSRKCPLCSASFDNSYLIHHIRSQFDYQKHYLPPPAPAPENRANALRRTRRERQWGRRARQEREEADQLERAIVRRRWIYQHHLYAKHVASNQFTRYRPFPLPAQFAASPDLISRMTIFLRRELRVWPNLDIEFLTTYTIALMKSIDIRSESAIKLLSEFLDLDVSYTAGARHANAEHFAHEIYSYLRSPYRDLNTYDQVAQYDAPPEIPPPQEIKRGNRWSAERSPSRSRSGARRRSPVSHHENNTTCPSGPRYRDRSADDRPEARYSVQTCNRSPRLILADQEYHCPRNHPSSEGQDCLRDRCPRTGTMEDPGTSISLALFEYQDGSLPAQSRSPHDIKGKGPARGEQSGPKTSVLEGVDLAPAEGVSEAGVGLDASDDGVADGVMDDLGHNSSAIIHSPRKRLDGPHAHVRPRNRTLSESVKAYLAHSTTTRPMSHKPPGRVNATQESNGGTTRRHTSTTDMHRGPTLLFRLTDGPTSTN